MGEPDTDRPLTGEPAPGGNRPPAGGRGPLPAGSRLPVAGRLPAGRLGPCRASWLRLALLLPLGFLAVFFIYPLWAIAREALLPPAVLSVLTDPYFIDVFQFSIGQALLSTLLSVAVGFPLAYLLSTYRFPGRELLRSLTLVPFVLPTISVAVGFLLMFGQNGFLNRALYALFGLRLPILYSLTGVLLAHAFYNAPLLVRTIHAAWEAIDPSLEEAARTLGASPRRVFWTVTLPALVPGMATGAALAFIFCFLSFPLVLTLGGGRLATVEVEIYTQVRLLLNYRTGTVLALLETAVSLLFSFGYLLLERHFARPAGAVRPRPLRPLRLPRRGREWLVAAGLGLVFAVLTVLYAGPLGALIYHSLQLPREGGWTLRWYRYVFAPEYDAILGDTPLASIRNSLLFALATTGVAMAVALPLSRVLAGGSDQGHGRAGGKGQGRGLGHGLAALEALAMLPLAISPVAFGFGVLQAFNRPPLLLSGTGWAIVAAHSVLAYPFVIRAVRPALGAISRQLPEVSRTLGASAARTFFRVELPLAATGLLTGALLSFGFSLAEVSATVLLAGPGLATMPVTLYHLLAARNFGGASAMAVVLLVVTAVSFTGLEAAGRYWLRRAAGAAGGRRW